MVKKMWQTQNPSSMKSSQLLTIHLRRLLHLDHVACADTPRAGFNLLGPFGSSLPTGTYSIPWYHGIPKRAIYNYKDQKIWWPCFFELLSWPETWSRWAIHGSKQEGNCHRNMTKIEKWYKTILPIISKDQPWNIVKCSSARIQRPAHVWAPSPPTNRTDHSATKNKTELCRYATESFVEISNTSSVNWHLLMTYFRNKYIKYIRRSACWNTPSADSTSTTL